MGERIRFFPVDVLYKVHGGKPVVYLYGRTPEGQQVCATDDSQQPYFYVLSMEQIKDRLAQLTAEDEGRPVRVSAVQEVTKEYFGKPINLFKVIVGIPGDVPILREIVKSWPEVKDIFEYDVLFARRYLLDKGLIPLTLTEVEGELVQERSKVAVIKASSLKQEADEVLANPRILAVDIETYNPHGKFVDMDKQPIIMLAVYGENFEKVVVSKRIQTTLPYVESVDSEEALLKRFADFVEEYNPDILTGYYSDGFDLPYIMKRAEKYRISLNLGLDYSEMRGSRQDQVSINGIAHIDILKFIKRIMRSDLELDSYDLDTVAFELLGEKKVVVDLNKLAPAWDKETEELEMFCVYNLHDARLTYQLCEKLYPNILELVKMIGMTPFDITRMAYSQLVESYLMRRACPANVLVPNRPGYQEISERNRFRYEGAFVFQPKPGLYENIVLFDFRSLYPTIIVSHNIGPESLNCDCCSGAAVVPSEKPEQRYRFCQKKRGFIPTIIEEIITRRTRIKQIMKEQKSPVLNARQNSLKLMANSFYGYLGFAAARWYSLESARSITAYARYYIQKVISEAQAAGFEVLYSDTDSVFLQLGKKTKEDALRFAEKVNLELPGIMELEYEGMFKKGIFVSLKEGGAGAKKKYALLSEKGTIKITGFESVRRNVCDLAKETQEQVLEIILREGDRDKALDYVRQVVRDLKQNKIPVDKVVIMTQLRKETESYDSVGPHVAIARQLEAKGIQVSTGTLIRYVIVKGSGRLRDRAKLPEETSQQEYDSEYYINNQVMPAVGKIFEVMGFAEEDLIQEKEQSTLGKFF